jgi:acyl phosphate:glycerol-3-phosphate acyltransferase
LVTCLAFVLGSIPSGIILAKLTTGRDVRQFGSGNFGAANVARAAGFKVGVGVALLDILKGVLPVLLGRMIGVNQVGLAAIALAAVAGHDFSVFLRFRGGKGVATTVGVALILAPGAAVLAIVTWLVVLAISRFSSLASLIALALLPVYMAATGQPSAYAALAVGLFILGSAKHWENIIRLASGTEQMLGKSRTADSG